ncbi:thiamine pyrophosphate-requiring protein [Ginsengibacter hankyongi]|uniref:Thiamine pyrophosphate-requiring protein n=1 Tax=Ginsengibacter hankyongi TaxID=2607284 RepID=A0A5J5IL40_9BACT|nr:thiamine pyrophosphate-requiring protein [Ginsengibacter hankyongi]KAA9041786.1 thiamine pyrophosphate-requiring protein [Ginsengibacter hankyongi]
MSQTVGDFLVNRLSEWGVTRVFGFPGDGINGLMGSMDRAKDKIDFIQVRHEENAAFMACGHAKFTGEVGVCMATSGPGAIHLLNGLYDAKMDHAPVVAIVGQQARAAMGGSYQQEVDLISLYKDVAHEYVHMATVPSQIRHLVDRAIRIAKNERCVTCIIIPNDLQDEDFEEPKRTHGTVHSGLNYSTPRIIPHQSDLQRAADILNEGKKVAMLVGAGALEASDEVLQVADLLGAGIAKALLGKAVVPDELPFVTGSIGLLGTKPSWDLMMGCDTLLMVGSSFPYSEFLPKEGQAKAIQIDIDGKMLGIRYPMDINLQGDSKETLKALIPLLQRKEDRNWRETIASNLEEWWKVLEARAMNSADPINPQRLFWELSKQLPDNCILSSDSGTSADWFARDIKIRKGMKASLSGNLATMCPGVPYAIAAKFAYPDRMSIALVGDGAMQMLGNNGLITIAKYWKRWSDARLMIVVLNNRDLNQVTWEQRIMEGDPKFEGSQNVPDFPYAEYAKMLGLDGIKIDKPEDIVPSLEFAFTLKRPVVLDVYTDPSVPPLPPHITFKQAKAFASSMIKGDTNSWDMIKQSWKDVIENYLPHTHN